MLDCYDNIIGIDRTCSVVEPVSGLFIQDLAGINLKVADSITDSTYSSGVAFLKSKIAFATALMLAEVRATLKDKVKYGTVLSNQNIGYVDINSIMPSEIGLLKGIRLQIQDYSFFEMFLQSISVFSNENKTIDVFIYDLITGKLLETIPVVALTGVEVNVLVNKKYYTQRKSLDLFVCTSSELSHYNAKLNKSHCNGCTNTINNGYQNISTVQVLDINPITQSNVQACTSTGGISVSYSLSCSIEPFLCNISSLLGMPLLYKAGAVIMNEGVNTDRLNSIVLTNKEDYKVLRDSYEEQYLVLMQSLLGSMRLPNDICFKCNSKIRTMVQIP